MYQGKRVVAFTPWGRKRTASILFKYLEREAKRGLLDEWMLCMNTGPNQDDDIDYALHLAHTYDWINLYPRPGLNSFEEDLPEQLRQKPHETVQLNTGRFYWYMKDRETIYVRFDDDIVWLHPDALPTLVDRKIRRPEHIAVFPLILNNAICSWFLQQHGRIPQSWGEVKPHCMDPNGWENPQFAENLHRDVLKRIRTGKIDDLMIPLEHKLGRRQQFSVSCFAISGNEYADLNGVLNWDEEEHWLTMHQPGIINRDNIICGQALVAHFSFFPHRTHLLRKGILQEYERLTQFIPNPPITVRLPEGESEVTTHEDAALNARGDAYYEELHP